MLTLDNLAAEVVARLLPEGVTTGHYLQKTAEGWEGSEVQIPDKASNAQVDAETDDSAYTTVAKVFRAIGRKLKDATESVRGTVLLARSEDVANSETDLTRVPTVARAITLIRRLIDELVRSIPTPERSHFGQPFVANRTTNPYGRYQQLGTEGYGDGSITRAKLDSALQGQIDGSGGDGGTSQPYVLPAAAAGVRGGVQAITNEIIDADTSTGIFGWAISHVKRVVTAVVPSWAREANPPLQRSDLPPFATILAVPSGIPGNDFPTPFEIFFSERLTDKTISAIRVEVGGSRAQIDSTTPLSNIAATARDSGALRFALASSAINNIKTSIQRLDTEVDFQIFFTYSDGTSYLHSIPFPVHNSVFADRGVPTGGTDGQLLAKDGAVEYRTEWVDAPSGGASIPAFKEFNFATTVDRDDVASWTNTNLNITGKNWMFATITVGNNRDANLAIGIVDIADVLQRAQATSLNAVTSVEQFRNGPEVGLPEGSRLFLSRDTSNNLLIAVYKSGIATTQYTLNYALF